jgi:2-methylisocitrate lyase-like PEP mutase family enzyme
MNEARARLRRQLATGDLVLAPGAYDPLTARIVERAGFDAVYLGGNALGLSLGKGQPFVTLTETVRAVAAIAATTEAAVIVDAGAGFGEAQHVHGAVRELEGAGAAALHIDDQPYPKRASYHRGQGALAPVAEVARKLAVAVAARRDPNLLIIARTDALRVTKSVDETLARSRDLIAAGAQALMVLDLGPDQAARFREAFPSTFLVWIGGVVAPVPTRDQLAAAGFALAVYPFNTLAAVASSVADLWRGLAQDGAVNQSDALLTRMRGETLALADLQPRWDIEDGK